MCPIALAPCLTHLKMQSTSSTTLCASRLVQRAHNAGVEERSGPNIGVLSMDATPGLQIMAATAGVDGESLPAVVADPAVVTLLQVRALC